MPSVIKYYIDKRVFKSGRKNPFLNLADTHFLNDLVYQIIYGTAPNTTTGPLLIQNGLSSQVTPQNFLIEMGGPLLRDTVVLGNNYNFTINNISELLLDSQDLALCANNSFILKTPDLVSASNGWVLTLVDSLTGEAEWQPAAGGAVTGADNGLSVLGSNVELGGTLYKNTLIEGAGYTIDFNALDSFVVTGDFGSMLFNESALLQANTGVLTVASPNSLRVRTPACFPGAPIPAVAGQVLTLLNPFNGEAEYTSFPAEFGVNIYNSSGSLLDNRFVIGQGFSLTFDDLDGYTITNLANFDIFDCETVSISGDDSAELKSETSLRLNTPNIGTQTEVSVGQVLTLTNSANGQAEWTTLPSIGGDYDVVIVGAGPHNANLNELSIVNAAAAAITVNLPNATPSGKRIVVKKIDNANTVRVEAQPGELIDGQTFVPLNIQFEALSLVSTGTTWVII
jgi:hypothetical protein